MLTLRRTSNRLPPAASTDKAGGTPSRRGPGLSVNKLLRWFPAAIIVMVACAPGKTLEPPSRVLMNAGPHCRIPGGPGALKGLVVDDSTREPVPGVRVVLSPGGREAVTDSAGSYAIGTLCPSTYTIRVVSASHYQWSRPRIYVATDSTVVRDVHVAPFLCTDVTPLGHLTGVVVHDSTRAPVEGAQVLVFGSMCGVITDRDGRFTLPAVPAGNQRVIVRRIGYAVIERRMNIPAREVTSLWFELRPAPTHLLVNPATADSARSH